MKRNIFLTAIAVVILSIFSGTLLSALDVPQLKGRVNDYANVLSSREEGEIEELLTNLERTTSAQAVVLTIPSLEDDSLEGFSIRTVDAWKLGGAEKDNGVLILLALAEKKVRIEVGYGLEGSLTDAKSGYIVREVMIPYFKNGDYAGGLLAASKAVSGVITAEADISQEDLRQASSTSSTKQRSGGFNFSFIVIFIFFSILRGLGRAFGRNRYHRRSGAGGLGRALFWGSVLGSAGRRGSSGGGGFGSGGFGGGGFSGGGGGFGGGGASGGW
ncbi:MAG: TPM domain-containing protein [Spirochaetales bacterium]|nr:TPM domain-containing protein [Spirochaetales bacterium]